jgi:hypothetical protein
MTIPQSKIEELATAPERTRTLEGTIEERPIEEVVLADQYAQQRTAVDRVPWGIRVARIKPGSTIS